MFCQICNRQLAPVEPIYRLQLGAPINHGWRASLCKNCLDHFGSTRLYQIPPFREQDCEHCGRPVLTPSRWKPKRAICSAKCRGALETKRAKQLRAWRRSERECWHCRKKFAPKRIDQRYCSLACKQAAYRWRMDVSAN